MLDSRVSITKWPIVRKDSIFKWKCRGPRGKRFAHACLEFEHYFILLLTCQCTTKSPPRIRPSRQRRRCRSRPGRPPPRSECWRCCKRTSGPKNSKDCDIFQYSEHQNLILTLTVGENLKAFGFSGSISCWSLKSPSFTLKLKGFPKPSKQQITAAADGSYASVRSLFLLYKDFLAIRNAVLLSTGIKKYTSVIVFRVCFVSV